MSISDQQTARNIINSILGLSLEAAFSSAGPNGIPLMSEENNVDKEDKE